MFLSKIKSIYGWYTENLTGWCIDSFLLFFTDGSSYKRGDVTNLIFYCKEDGTKVQYYDKIVASTHINKLLF